MLLFWSGQTTWHCCSVGYGGIDEHGLVILTTAHGAIFSMQLNVKRKEQGTVTDIKFTSGICTAYQSGLEAQLLWVTGCTAA